MVKLGDFDLGSIFATLSVRRIREGVSKNFWLPSVLVRREDISYYILPKNASPVMRRSNME